MLAFLLGCATPPSQPATPNLTEHLADARSITSVGGPEKAGESLAGIQARVLQIRNDWQERLRAPESMPAFYDFASPEMTALRAVAAGDAFPDALADEVTLPLLLAGAFVRHPELQAAEYELRATVEQYAQVTYLDTILRQYVSFLRTLDTRIGPAVPMDQVQKRFPFPGTLELKAAVVGHAVEAARARYDGVLQDMVTGVRVAYADYVFLAQAIGITRESLGYLEQLEASVRGKLAAGTAEQAHVLQTQVELSGLRNELITLRQKRETVRARLSTVLNLPPDTPLGEPVVYELKGFPADLDALSARALEEQPRIRQAEAGAARMATMIELAERATYPELSAGFSIMAELSPATQGSGRDREPFSTRPQVKPDPWFGSKEAYLREVRESERAARAKATAMRNHTLFRLKDAHVELDTARRLFELYRDVQVSQAMQAYQDAAAGYSADRVAFLNVIDALRRTLGFLLAKDRAERDYHQAHARLENAIGGPANRKAEARSEAYR